MKILIGASVGAAMSLLLIIWPGEVCAQNVYGDVSFVNSGPEEVQGDFLRGLAQLHNFEYDDAAKYFRQAERAAPEFAMAYWGEAMTKNHAVWHEQDLAAGREALERLGATPQIRSSKAPSAREKAYLHSVEVLYGEGGKEWRDQKYAAAMADLHAQFGDDVNAASFYALALLGSAEQGRDFAIYMRAAAVLEEVFPKNQMHPGVVHYLIHCYDDPIHAPLGLRAARIYAQIAPEAGHAQHMTSHIFLALGMWDDVVKANETAMAVVNRQRAETHKPPHFCGHYASWLAYGYLQLGRIPEARRMLEGCRGEAEAQAKSIANRPVASPDPDNSAAGSFAEMRAHFLIDSQLWNDEVGSWPLPGGADGSAQMMFDYTNALAAFHKGDVPGAREFSARVEADRKLAQARLDKNKSQEPNDAKRLGIMSDQLLALVAPQNASEQTIKALREIADREHALPLEFGPPDIPAPTSELLGETLLRLHHSAEARSAFEADLAGAPGRRLAVQGLAAAGNDPDTVAHGADAAKDKAKDAHVHQ